ncbi:MAG: hypothetical protein LAP86_06570 [Acidobacteriia bacterium]|nr:hypothetical protein [Terriglobia bacterium]
MRKVTRKQWQEGVTAYQSYQKKVNNKTISVVDAEKFLSKVATVDEVVRETIKPEKRRVTINETSGKPEEFRPDFGLLGLKPEEAKIANQETGNTNPATMTNQDWSNIFDRSNRNGR